MKINMTKIIAGKICLVALLLSFGFKSYSASHLTMTIGNCSTSETEIRFDFLLQNDGDQPLKFNSGSFRLVHDAAILPAGNHKYSLTYVDGTSEFPALFSSRPNSYNLKYSPENMLMQFTTNPANYSHFNAITIPAGGKAMRVGTFSLKITDGQFVAGADVNTALYPSGNGAVVYVNGATATSNFGQFWAIEDGSNKSGSERDAANASGLAVARTSGKVMPVSGNYAGAPYSSSNLNINVNSTCRIAGKKSANNLTAGNSFTAYPNPTTGKSTIAFSVDAAAKYSLKVVDVLGAVIMKHDINALEGYNSKELNLENVAKGMYFVSLQTEGSDAQTMPLVVE